jgi:DNA invertase Pin-like site-specific DNA recombinase
MTAAATSSWNRSSGKVAPWHRDRLAVVYVRQSTRQQVAEHGESTRLQYGLVERAVALGWARSRVLVIDEDLGRSGASAVDRPGFQRLVTEVTMDHVGVVLGIEMSRLARAGKDWHQLLELCSLARTLLADTDGVYDPNEYNDRLLLGLKGTMSEVELHMIKQRMQAGRLAKAGRGELALPLPIGYVRRLNGEVAFDPDEQVQSVVRLVFRLFGELGTVNAVLRYLVDHQVQLGMRLRGGPDKGELVWRSPNRVSVQNLLRNPAYAGIYAYGRSRFDPRRKIPGRPFTGRVRNLQDEWLVAIAGLLPAYISVEQYERNLARMRANQARADVTGAARDGQALLAGIVSCGMCGRRMTVRYQRSQTRMVHVYVCSRQKSDYGLPQCQQMAGVFLDTWVVAEAMAALSPATLELSLHAAGQIEAERAEVDRIWRQRVERAAAVCDRARRQFQLAEPENRLVVRQLEKDWEQALAAHQQLVEDYQRFTAAKPAVLSAADQETIRTLAADVPALWQAPTTTNIDRKEILRCLLEKVTVTTQGDTEQVHAEIIWAGGDRSSAILVRPVAKLEQLTYFPQLAARVRHYAAQGLTAAQIAELINAEGLRPPKRIDQFTTQAMRDLIQRLDARPGENHTRRPLPDMHPDEWWLPDLARKIGMPAISLYSWLRRGMLAARQESQYPHRWIVHAPPPEVERLRQLHNLPRGHHQRRRWNDTETTTNQEGTSDHAART